MTQIPLSFEPEQRAAERGKALAASANYRNVELARQIARELCAGGREICADDVRVEMTKRFPDTVYGNWCGSIFKGDDFIATGFTKSKTKGSHANLLRTWTLKA